MLTQFNINEANPMFADSCVGFSSELYMFTYTAPSPSDAAIKTMEKIRNSV